MTKLVQVVKGVPLVSTLDMCEPLGVQHRSIMALVQRYEKEFQGIRGFSISNVKTSGTLGGRPTFFCMLDEEQSTFLITLMKNSPDVVPFKLKLTREFYRMKTELIRISSQAQNAEWLEQRKSGKAVRLIATDTIKAFTDYATAQGSKNAKKYYVSISSMENKALWLLEQKYDNIRNILDINQLSTMKSADMIVMKALKDGMDRGLDYHDIFKLAKVRVESFAEVIGKTLIPNAQLQIGG